MAAVSDSKKNRATALAQATFFRNGGSFGHLIFGEMPAGEHCRHGVAANLESKRLYCTCSQYPKPCVHALALEMLDAPFPPVDELPEWVTALLAGRGGDRMMQTNNSGEKAAAQQQRRFERLERAAHGFDDLDTWLLDTMRRGLAAVVTEDAQWWKNIAERMADASMPGLSRTLRLLGDIPADAPDWADRTAAVLADCYLAVRAFRKRDQLPEPLLYDLQQYIGINTKKEAVLASGERVSDDWAVVGQIESVLEDKLLSRRSWLLGSRSGRFAQLLDYAFGGAGFPPGFAPGSVLRGTLAFYPSAYPLRAIAPDDLHELPEKIKALDGFGKFDTFATVYAAVLAEQPWLHLFPAAFNAILPYADKDRFFIADSREHVLPLKIPEDTGWQIMALSGGHPVSIFGEWDGDGLRPLGVLAEGRYVGLGGRTS